MNACGARAVRCARRTGLGLARAGVLAAGLLGSGLPLQAQAPAPPSAPAQLRPPQDRLLPVPAAHVRLGANGFWGPRLATNLLASLPHGAQQLREYGQFGNFRVAAMALGHGAALPGPPEDAPPTYRGVHYYDSDAYKWLEAACLALEQPAPAGLDPATAQAARNELRAAVDRFVEELAASQRDDGYIQTQYVAQGLEPFTKLGSDHELYCAGHLLQAAIAHQRATGSRRLLDVALKFADLIDRTFGPDAAAGERPGCCGHPEIETALVQLGLATNDPRWLAVAEDFIAARGHGYAGGDEARQDDKPVREQRVAAGHAVRQLYLASGALGVAAGTRDTGLLDANLAIWDDIAAGKLYVTGGLGARADGEAFGAPFELPNDRAYSETCASVAWMRWNQELVQLTGDGRFADALETTLYNAFLAGVGLDGRSFFYVNPLETHGGTHRDPWFWCACCPPNVMRTLAGLPGWVASVSRDVLWLHLYDDCEIETQLLDGRAVRVAVETDWPWSGDVTVRVLQAPQGPWTLALRLPGWAPDATTQEFGRPAGDGRSLGYAPHFQLATDDSVRVHVPFDVRRLCADPRLAADAGKLAVQRGPLVYAFESLDQPAPLDELSLDAAGPAVPEPVPDLGGITRLRLPGVQVPRAASAGLYAPVSTIARPVTLVAIPYYAWANRGDSALSVWMPAVPHVPDFADDVAFVREHADALVLQAEGCGPVLVSRKLSGRVMTSAFAPEERGFGLVNRAAIAAGPVARGFANYGGEDRLWLSPEGGPRALFFEPGAPQVAEHWSVPPGLDGGPRSLARQDERSLTFRDIVAVSDVRGATLETRVDRTVEALSRAEVEGLLGQPLPDPVRVVAFRSTNRLSWAGPPPADSLVGLWVLGQFVPDVGTRVLVPFRGAPSAIKRDYFGLVPDERLAFLPPAGNGAAAAAGSTGSGAGPEAGAAPGGVARFTADGRLRSKIGLSRAGATGWLGAWDAERGVLTLVQHSLPPEGAAVPDCDWRPDNPAFAQGDVATSYNDGGEPRFFELESLSAALPGEPGASVEHVHSTIHLGGDRAALAALARAILHAEL